MRLPVCKKLLLSFLVVFGLVNVNSNLHGAVVVGELLFNAIILALEVAQEEIPNPSSPNPTPSTNSSSAGSNITQTTLPQPCAGVCGDANTVANAFVPLSIPDRLDALTRASPVAYSGNTVSAFQTAREVAIVLDRQFQGAVRTDRMKKSVGADENPDIANYNPQTGFYIEPLGLSYSQKAVQGEFVDIGQPSFKSYSYGSGLGWVKVLKQKFVLELSGAYTHSNLHWSDDIGNSSWSSVYFAPFFGWFNTRAFANFMVMGGINFFKNDRKIKFSSIDRHAKSWFKSYDLLLRSSGGVRFNLWKKFWLQPEGALTFLTEFILGHKERGAGIFNLEVNSRNVYILQPTADLRFIQEFNSPKFYYAPSLYFGWLANILLKKDTVSSRFHELANSTPFDIHGYYKTANQFVVGAEFYALHINKILITTNFEANIFDRANIFKLKAKLEWLY